MKPMAARRIETEIDRLYQLAPDAFTAERNALAKTAGPDTPAVKRLVKPPIAAWAVNQVYWRRRDVYDALIKASKELRQAHKAVLSGKKGDVRTAAKAHDAALDAALRAALALLDAEGHPATEATRQAVATTLRALPVDDPPGRLTRTLQPGGFEMLAGLSIAAGMKGQSARTPKTAPPSGALQQKTAHAVKEPEDSKAAARAREAAAKAARELREAEHTARREEFEAARAAREADKASRQLEQARAALAEAQRELEAAEAAAKDAVRTREAADERAAAAEEALETARRRLES
jgi:hypothetical protein